MVVLFHYFLIRFIVIVLDWYEAWQLGNAGSY